MSNRYYNQFQATLAPKVVSLYAHVTFGASGAPTLDTANSKGIVSVTRNAAGKYTFVFGTKAGMLDTYNKLLMVKHVFDASGNSGTAPASPSMFILANSVATAGTCSLQVEFNAAGTATDPASGEGVYMEFIFKDSTAV
jgi:hypothetical protein